LIIVKITKPTLPIPLSVAYKVEWEALLMPHPTAHGHTAQEIRSSAFLTLTIVLPSFVHGNKLTAHYHSPAVADLSHRLS
jgi:hypothetical protein